MQPSQPHPSSNATGNLFNANLAFCLKVNELMQIGGQQWLESGRRLFAVAVTESAKRLARPGKDERQLPTTAGTNDVGRGSVGRWSVQVQAERRIAFEQQRSLSTKLREAMTTWGETVNGSLVRRDGVTPFADAWMTEMTKWTQAWPLVGKAK